MMSAKVEDVVGSADQVAAAAAASATAALSLEAARAGSCKLPPAPPAMVKDRWFRLADADGDGRVTGADAVAFFQRSGLPKAALARVWDLANSNRAGYLGRAEFDRALDLIALAQQGRELSKQGYLAALQEGPVPLPRMAGLEAGGGGGGGAGVGAPDAAAAAGADPRAKSPALAASPAADQQQRARAQQSATPPSQQKRRAAFGLRDARPAPPPRAVTGVVDGLKQIYLAKIRPLEEAFAFPAFFSSCLDAGDFDAKPSVLLLGQYSTGKTTFIRHLLGRSYPGSFVGPEPTTDRFVVVHHGVDDRRTPGNTLAVQRDKPFSGLVKFGTGARCGGHGD